MLLLLSQNYLCFTEQPAIHWKLKSDDVTSVLRTRQWFRMKSKFCAIAYNACMIWPCLCLPLISALHPLPHCAPFMLFFFFLNFCCYSITVVCFFAVPQTCTACSWIQDFNTYRPWRACQPGVYKGCLLSSFRCLFTFHLHNREMGRALVAQLLWRKREGKLCRYLFTLSLQRNWNADSMGVWRYVEILIHFLLCLWFCFRKSPDFCYQPPWSHKVKKETLLTWETR